MREKIRGDVRRGYAAESSHIDKVIERYRYILPLLLEWTAVRVAGVVTGNVQGVTVLFHLPIHAHIHSGKFAEKTL